MKHGIIPSEKYLPQYIPLEARKCNICLLPRGGILWDRDKFRGQTNNTVCGCWQRLARGQVMKGQIIWLIEVGRRGRLSKGSASIFVDRLGEVWHEAIALPDVLFDLAI